jgi:uncharacterized protein (DUF2141 family)
MQFTRLYARVYLVESQTLKSLSLLEKLYLSLLFDVLMQMLSILTSTLYLVLYILPLSSINYITGLGIGLENEIPKNARLELSINGVKKVEGCVLIAVYNKDTHFGESEPKHAVATKAVKVQAAGTLRANFNLPYGNYAVIAYHDVNNNKRLDKNFVGVPTEAIAISNGLKSKIRKPRFEESTITVGTAEPKVSMQLVSY